ncbi:hypothetical protein [Arthrobacter ramosus]|uniref:Uncharacterized protein n=1 Tax=Arthrobacter ramosus TaxID=1672 RepID=A0ABV5Y4N9_ARTRM|nr:hypothetical protein [Arthrobacter ramosus]
MLVEQLRVLEADDPLFILIGTKTAVAFKQRRSALAEVLGLLDVRSVDSRHYLAATRTDE